MDSSLWNVSAEFLHKFLFKFALALAMSHIVWEFSQSNQIPNIFFPFIIVCKTCQYPLIQNSYWRFEILKVLASCREPVWLLMAELHF